MASFRVDGFEPVPEMVLSIDAAVLVLQWFGTDAMNATKTLLKNSGNASCVYDNTREKASRCSEFIQVYNRIDPPALLVEASMEVCDDDPTKARQLCSAALEVLNSAGAVKMIRTPSQACLRAGDLWEEVAFPQESDALWSDFDVHLEFEGDCYAEFLHYCEVVQEKIEKGV